MVTMMTDNPNDLNGWFDYFDLHLKLPCAIIKVNSLSGVENRLYRKGDYALFALGLEMELDSIGANNTKSFRHPLYQEQLTRDDEVVKQCYDFSNNCRKAQ